MASTVSARCHTLRAGRGARADTMATMGTSRGPRVSDRRDLSTSLVRPREKLAARKVTAMGIFGLGLPEVAVIAGVAALLFGPKKLPELGKSLGKTVKSLQDAAEVSLLTDRPATST
mmetsp:Transcript_12322/g.31321  ORF Transcript_12322/g.31321 Transcript_12322/m.31321 type:complete len:117 (-) Transcript_12322:258-608(-)